MERWSGVEGLMVVGGGEGGELQGCSCVGLTGSINILAACTREGEFDPDPACRRGSGAVAP